LLREENRDRQKLTAMHQEVVADLQNRVKRMEFAFQLLDTFELSDVARKVVSCTLEKKHEPK